MARLRAEALVEVALREEALVRAVSAAVVVRRDLISLRRGVTH